MRVAKSGITGVIALAFSMNACGDSESNRTRSTTNGGSTGNGGSSSGVAGREDGGGGGAGGSMAGAGSGGTNAGASGDSGSGGQPNLGSPFTCGPSECATGVSYCYTFVPGVPGGSQTYECRTLPEACGGAADCSCVCTEPDAGVGSQCIEVGSFCLCTGETGALSIQCLGQ